MPEIDVLRALNHLVVKEQRHYQKVHKKPLSGRLQLFPRMFATGTQAKSWITCTAECHNYSDDLEPVPADYQANEHDTMRSCGQPWEHLMKPLHEGELLIKVRGKEMFIACGYHGMRLNLALEASIMRFDTLDVEEILREDAPGRNGSKTKSEKLRSFLLANRFIVPKSQDLRKERIMNVFATINCGDLTFLLVDFARLVQIHVISLDRHWKTSDLEPNSEIWSALWGTGHGPDLIDELDAARAGLREWQAFILANPNSSAAHAPIAKEMCSKQKYWNGYGRHTVMDALHNLGIWPGTPCHFICREENYPGFEDGVFSYVQQWASQTYLSRVATTPNLNNPLHFNYNSHNNYMSQYVLVYRKPSVMVPAALYNKLYCAGLLDHKHQMGQPYNYDPSKLTKKERVKLPVFTYYHDSYKLYSVIRAKPSSEWRFQVSRGYPTEDVRHAGYKTTLGAASFHNTVQNMYNPKLKGIPGRRPKERTGRPGRPAQRPTHAKIQRGENVGLKYAQKITKELQQEQLEDEAEEDLERGNLSDVDSDVLDEDLSVQQVSRKGKKRARVSDSFEKIAASIPIAEGRRLTRSQTHAYVAALPVDGERCRKRTKQSAETIV